MQRNQGSNLPQSIEIKGQFFNSMLASKLLLQISRIKTSNRKKRKEKKKETETAKSLICSQEDIINLNLPRKARHISTNSNQYLLK